MPLSDHTASWRRRHCLQLAASAALLPWAAARAQQPPAAPMPAVGSPLPLAPAPLLNGGHFDPVQTEGRVLVLYWWASTCPFCALQSPEVDKLWRNAHARGLDVLGLSIDKRPDDALAYLRKKGYTFPSAWLGPDLATAYPKPEGLPVTIVRSRDGHVLQAEKGQMFAEDVAELERWL